MNYMVWKDCMWFNSCFQYEWNLTEGYHFWVFHDSYSVPCMMLVEWVVLPPHSSRVSNSILFLSMCMFSLRLHGFSLDSPKNMLVGGLAMVHTYHMCECCVNALFCNVLASLPVYSCLILSVPGTRSGFHHKHDHDKEFTANGYMNECSWKVGWFKM